MGLNLKITSQTIKEDFDRIAYELMNEWLLTVNETYYRITEIEFYYDHISKENQTNEAVKDPYAHRHEHQKKSGTWYFHGSGLDLTCGSDDYYGGILIRGIHKIKEDRHITGPLNSVTEILSAFGSCEKKQIEFGLEKASKLQTLAFDKINPIKAPRVGLNSSKDEIAHQKPFRYLIFPKETNRDKSIIIDYLVKKEGIQEADAKKLVYK